MHPFLCYLLGLIAVVSACKALPGAPYFERRFPSAEGVVIAEAPQERQIDLVPHPSPNVLVSRRRALSTLARARRNEDMGQVNALEKRWGEKHGLHHTEALSTLFSGVYPMINVTWGTGATAESYDSFVDTGSSDTFVVSSDVQCLNISTLQPLNQSACLWGPLYDQAKVQAFTPDDSLYISLEYYPENETLYGQIGTAPITVGGVTVDHAKVALMNRTGWVGDGHSSGLFGLAYPSITSALWTANKTTAPYNPIFFDMIAQGVVNEQVFTLAIDREQWGYGPHASAGKLALGGVVSPRLYEGDFSTVDIEAPEGSNSSQLQFYTFSHSLHWRANASQPWSTWKGGADGDCPKYQSVLDCGTAANFFPSNATKAINALFDPPAVWDQEQEYYIVDCNATAPEVAIEFDGKLWPMDKRDMIMRQLNALPGWENTCFSSINDGGVDPSSADMIVGAVWQHSVVTVHDVGRGQLHIAKRSPY